MNTRVNDIFSIRFPIIQAGMVWCSGWELASAVSNSGGLGLIGSGSMSPEILREHIIKTRSSTNMPFGVNVPLIYSNIEETMKVVVEEKVPVVFTSAGSPSVWTSLLKKNGIKVVHVVSNVKFAVKSEEAGVDAIVAEGVEAGGHNGREETTTFVLLQLIKKQIKLPVIAAGGIATGRGMLAAFAIGAEGVQIGSRFVASVESSAHINFKNKILTTIDGGTQIALRQLNPVRLIKNELYRKIETAESNCAGKEELKEIVGKGLSKLGMFEGNLSEGELEIGQIAALIDEIKPASEIIHNLVDEYNMALDELKGMRDGKLEN
jgi:enoyl-[acyl-carrier protein] reductase II